MGSPRVSFIAYPPSVRELVEGVANGAALGGAAQDLLQHMAWLLQRSLRRTNFTEAEALLLCDALNGIAWQPAVRPPLDLDISEAIALEGLAMKWGIDGKSLVEKLRALDDTAATAVMLAVKRWWSLPETQRNRKGLVLVGLVKPAAAVV